MMTAEHRRPLAAFCVVFAVACLIMANGLRTQVVDVLIGAGAPPELITAIAPDMVLGQSLRDVPAAPVRRQATSKPPAAAVAPVATALQAPSAVTSFVTPTRPTAPPAAPARQQTKKKPARATTSPVRSGSTSGSTTRPDQAAPAARPEPVATPVPVPSKGVLATPGKPSFQAPSQPSFQAPSQPSFQAPGQPSFQAPGQSAGGHPASGHSGNWGHGHLASPSKPSTGGGRRHIEPPRRASSAPVRSQSQTSFQVRGSDPRDTRSPGPRHGSRGDNRGHGSRGDSRDHGRGSDGRGDRREQGDRGHRGERSDHGGRHSGHHR
jgi:hypothetical protein